MEDLAREAAEVLLHFLAGAGLEHRSDGVGRASNQATTTGGRWAVSATRDVSAVLVFQSYLEARKYNAYMDPFQQHNSCENKNIFFSLGQFVVPRTEQWYKMKIRTAARR